MATATPISAITFIGETAGLIWKALDAKGPMSMARLVKAVGRPRDVVMQGIGWLAREDKVAIEEDRHTRVISLR